jgi:hypothetical protein
MKFISALEEDIPIGTLLEENRIQRYSKTVNLSLDLMKDVNHDSEHRHCFFLLFPFNIV